MIKNDKGKIEIEAGKAPEIILEWMQLTQAITMAVKESTGIEMDLEMLIQYGTKMINAMEQEDE